MKILEVKNLTKSFESKKLRRKETVLDGVSFSVEKSDVISLIGQSGVGKTTLLRCLNFLERADSGTLFFDGEEFDVSKITKKEIKKIRMKTSFVFQNYNLFLNKTALQNVTEGLTVARKMNKKDAQTRAKTFLDKVGLADKYDSFPSELSGGQQQRVAIARSLATEPEIIYFDEPTSALDPKLTAEVLSVMKTLAAEGKTMIIVTHEMEFAEAVSTKIIEMKDGKIASCRDGKNHHPAFE